MTRRKTVQPTVREMSARDALDALKAVENGTVINCEAQPMPGGYYCQNCSLVMVQGRGGICAKCAELLAARGPIAGEGINETPPGELQRYLIGDLGPARRHLQRLKQQILQPTPAVLEEISRSVESCVERIRRDVPAPGSARSLLHMQADYDLSKPQRRRGRTP